MSEPENAYSQEEAERYYDALADIADPIPMPLRDDPRHALKVYRAIALAALSGAKAAKEDDWVEKVYGGGPWPNVMADIDAVVKRPGA